jgi:hypothetical protein
MCCKVAVSLLVSGVLGNEVEVFSSDDDGSVHFGRNDTSSQNAAADRDQTGEGAFLVCTHRLSDLLSLDSRDPLFWSQDLFLSAWSLLTDI